jgi:hypothetical protein
MVLLIRNGLFLLGVESALPGPDGAMTESVADPRGTIRRDEPDA